MTPPADIQAGQELDHYRIDALVSATGLVSVFRATDLTDGRTVAIKIPNQAIEEDPVLFDRFKREEEIGARMDHPNIMRVYANAHPSRLYMVMEWCNGRLLREIMDTQGKLPQDRTIKITLGILRGLEYIHGHGVVDRDLKPESVMVDDHDNIKLLSFGIASLEGAKRLTYTGHTQALGTPDYMAPEQVKGKRGEMRSDLYSLGIMLYEMLTGKTPFSGSSPIAVMNARLINHPPPPTVAEPSITPQLQEVIYRAIEREPTNRYPTAHDFARDLEHLDQVGVSDRNELTHWKPHKTVPSRIILYVLLALLPAVLFVLMLMLSHDHR